MKLSDAGLRLVCSFEGYSDRAYPDPGSADGKPVTIGYGSTRWEDGSPIELGQFIDRARAETLLRRDIAAAETAVLGAVTVPLSQGQFDALVSWTYNVGIGALEKSTLLRRLNAGDYAGAADELLRWDKNDGKVMAGLTRRRRAERDLFLTGAPATAAPQPSTEARPMAPLVPALLSILAGYAPQLVKILGDQSKPVAERNVAAGLKVLEIARDIAGTDGPAAAVEAIAADPVKQAAFREAVEVRWYELTEAGGGGIEGARRANLEMTDGNSWRAIGWGATLAVLAIGVVIGGGAVMSRLLFGDIDQSLAAQILDYFKAAGFIVLGYAFGSSVSSRAKDDALAQRVPR